MYKNWSESRYISFWIALLGALCCFFFVETVSAQISQKDIPVVSEYRNTLPGSPIWTPVPSLPDKFDWIQLTSGEWLKGDIKVLYEDTLEFDSDKLDLLEFDWKDVKQVRSHKLNSVRFEGPVTVAGILKVVDDRVFVITGEEVREFERSRLVSIAPGGELEEINYWSAKISASLDVKKGNSDQVDYSASARIQRRTSGSRFFVDYQGAFNLIEGTETANNHRLTTYYDIFQTRNFFWRPVFVEYFRDPFSNIKKRVTVGSGIGYHIINTSKTELAFSPGLAYQHTENVSVESDQDTDNSTPALVVSTRYDTELTKKTDLNAKYSFNIVNQASGRYTHTAKVTLEIELTHRLDLDFSVGWDRIQEPKAAEDGQVPDQDDFSFFCGIGFEI